jgi:hypothetical protein
MQKYQMKPQMNLVTQASDRMRTRLSRRQFLIGFSTLATAGVLTACQSLPNLPSVRPTPPAPTATPDAVDGETLTDFLRFSSVLTEFDDLGTDEGNLYLKSIVELPDPNSTLEQLYETSGFRSASPPQTLAELEQTGVFTNLNALTLLNRINEYWYTGIYDTADGQAVATFTGALTWRALTFAHPVSTCGGETNYWDKPPINA